MKDLIFIKGDDTIKYLWNPFYFFKNMFSSEFENGDIIDLKEADWKLKNCNFIDKVSTFKSGMLFIKHPFEENSYIELSKLENDLFHRKINCLSQIAQLLGAKKYRGHAEIIKSEKIEKEFGGGYCRCNLDDFKSEEKRISSTYTLDKEFKTEKVEVQYDEAVRYAKQFGLEEEADVKDLLDGFNPNRKNFQTKHKVVISLSSELNSIVNRSVSIKALPQFYQLDSQTKKTLTQLNEVRFELEIEF